ncbi:MAG: hypothetical protein WAM39_32005, partial [Bryobacteraceae bacterium]
MRRRPAAVFGAVIRKRRQAGGHGRPLAAFTKPHKPHSENYFEVVRKSSFSPSSISRLRPGLDLILGQGQGGVEYLTG